MPKSVKQIEIENHRPQERRDRYHLLASWYGPEFSATEMAAHTEKASEVSSLMPEMLKSVMTPEMHTRMEIDREWRKFGGALLAKYGKVVSLTEGILVIEIMHPALLMECGDTGDLVKTKINEVFGAGTCVEVKMVPAGRLGRISRGY